MSKKIGVKTVEKIFYEKGTFLTELEAIEKAKLMYKFLKEMDVDLTDYFFGLAENYDLNIWSDNGVTGVVLYAVTNNETDYNAIIRVIDVELLTP
ncbi:MAG: hypothetical protein M0R03_23045 [Novosphingobium sp.]|nr:hypothetical protein [Novosphingobium sp.]